VDGDRLAHAQAIDSGANLMHPAGVLMAEGKGRPPRKHAVGHHVHDVQIGVAGAGAGDLDDDLARARCGGLDIDDLGFGLPGEELHCAHGLAFRGRGDGTSRSE
jgi:hypothetical protein